MRPTGRSKRWFYIWRKRYQSGDPNWFQDRPSAPHSKPTKTDNETRNLIVTIRKRLEAEPGSRYGAIAVGVELEKQGITAPATRTIARIFKENHLVGRNEPPQPWRGRDPGYSGGT